MRAMYTVTAELDRTDGGGEALWKTLHWMFTSTTPGRESRTQKVSSCMRVCINCGDRYGIITARNWRTVLMLLAADFLIYQVFASRLFRLATWGVLAFFINRNPAGLIAIASQPSAPSLLYSPKYLGAKYRMFYSHFIKSSLLLFSRWWIRASRVKGTLLSVSVSWTIHKPTGAARVVGF